MWEADFPHNDSNFPDSRKLLEEALADVPDDRGPPNRRAECPELLRLPLSAAPPEVRTPPLEGLRVVDLSEGVAGGYCTKALADGGAEVIKVEPPEGDALRHWAIGAHLEPGVDGPLFEFLACSKRSVVADPEESCGPGAGGGACCRAADIIVWTRGSRLAELLGVRAPGAPAPGPAGHCRRHHAVRPRGAVGGGTVERSDAAGVGGVRLQPWLARSTAGADRRKAGRMVGWPLCRCRRAHRVATHRTHRAWASCSTCRFSSRSC